MDNHIFRSAFNGFNRQDVAAYIEKSQMEAANHVAELEKKLEILSKSEEVLRGELESSRREYDALRENFQEQANEYAQTKFDLEAQLNDMREEVSAARREKESVAQLELEARRRSEDMMAEKCAQAQEIVEQAHAQAHEILTSANEQSEDIINKAHQSAETIRCEMEERVRHAGEKVDELSASVETIVAHVSAELRKMDVAVAQLPINFNHLKDGMKKVLELASSPVDEKIEKK